MSDLDSNHRTLKNLKFILCNRIVEHLLHCGANPIFRDYRGYTAAHYAALSGHKLALEMVTLVLRNSSDAVILIVQTHTYTHTHT